MSNLHFQKYLKFDWTLPEATWSHWPCFEQLHQLQVESHAAKASFPGETESTGMALACTKLTQHHMHYTSPVWGAERAGLANTHKVIQIKLELIHVPSVPRLQCTVWL